MSRRLVFTVLILSLLSSCGFHLRGSYPMPEILNNVIVYGGSRDFEEKLAESLQERGVNVYKLAEQQDLPRISVTYLNFKRSVNTKNAAGRATGYSYKLDADFRIIDTNGEILLPKTTLVQTRTQEYDPAELLELEEEEEFLRNQMEDELILQMLRRFSRL